MYNVQCSYYYYYYIIIIIITGSINILLIIYIKL